MRILGVDPGYTLGYAVVEDERNLLTFGILKTEGSSSRRLSSIYNKVLSLIGEFSVDLLALEEAFYGKNAKSLIKLAEARGAVLAAAGSRNVEVVELHPSEVKRGVTGRGSATKEQVRFMVSQIFGLKKINHHEADAISIAFCAFSRRRGYG